MAQSTALLASDSVCGASLGQGAEPSSLPIVDLVHLSKQTLGDNALELELLGLFDRQALHMAARLGAPFRSEEHKWRADLAHTLKGSATAVGAFGVAAAAADYEDAARAGAVDLSARFEALRTAIEAARNVIASLLETSAKVC